MGGYAFHSEVAGAQAHVQQLQPCRATAPKSSRGRAPKDAQERWLADKRQYAGSDAHEPFERDVRPTRLCERAAPRDTPRLYLGRWGV